MALATVNRRVLPALLFLTLVIPTGAGIYRMIDIIGAGNWALKFQQDHVDHLPLFIHAGTSILFLCLGALQILPGFRKRHMKWHRRAGKIAVLSGLIGAASGLWMTLLHRDISTDVLFAGRLFASTFWFLALVLALVHVRNRHISAHRDWMIRAYAIALPAGTLAWILFPLVLILGEVGFEFLFELVQVLAWPIHLIVAEIVIRKISGRSPSLFPTFSKPKAA